MSEPKVQAMLQAIEQVSNCSEISSSPGPVNIRFQRYPGPGLGIANIFHLSRGPDK